MSCKYSRQGAKDYYCDNYDRYFEERAEAFKEFMEGVIQSYVDSANDENGNLSFVDLCDDTDTEFEFPDVDDWLSSEYEGMLGDCADQAYELYRDRQMGLD